MRENRDLTFPFAFQVIKNLSQEENIFCGDFFFSFLFEGIITTIDASSKDSRRISLFHGKKKSPAGKAKARSSDRTELNTFLHMGP